MRFGRSGCTPGSGLRRLTFSDKSRNCRAVSSGSNSLSKQIHFRLSQHALRSITASSVAAASTMGKAPARGNPSMIDGIAAFIRSRD